MFNFKSKKRVELERLEKEAEDQRSEKREELIDAVREAQRRISRTWERRRYLQTGEHPYGWDYDDFHHDDPFTGKSIEQLERLLERSQGDAECCEKDLKTLATRSVESARTQVLALIEHLEGFRSDRGKLDLDGLPRLERTLEDLRREIDLFWRWEEEADSVEALADFDFESFRMDMEAALRRPAFRVAARRNLVEKHLAAWLPTPGLAAIKEGINESFADRDALALFPSPLRESALEAFRVSSLLPLYRLPAVALLGEDYSGVTDTLLLDSLDEADVEVIATLLGGDAYPTLASARDAALAIA